MNNRVSFAGIGEVMATFYAGEDVKAGHVVKLGGDSTVAACADGEGFCGVAVSVKEGCAGVQVEGFADLSCSDSGVAVGRVALAADGSGGVKKAAGGQEYWVVANDGAGTITVKM